MGSITGTHQAVSQTGGSIPITPAAEPFAFPSPAHRGSRRSSRHALLANPNPEAHLPPPMSESNMTYQFPQTSQPTTPISPVDWNAYLAQHPLSPGIVGSSYAHDYEAQLQPSGSGSAYPNPAITVSDFSAPRELSGVPVPQLLGANEEQSSWSDVGAQERQGVWSGVPAEYSVFGQAQAQALYALSNPPSFYPPDGSVYPDPSITVTDYSGPFSSDPATQASILHEGYERRTWSPCGPSLWRCVARSGSRPSQLWCPRRRVRKCEDSSSMRSTSNTNNTPKPRDMRSIHRSPRAWRSTSTIRVPVDRIIMHSSSKTPCLSSSRGFVT